MINFLPRVKTTVWIRQGGREGNTAKCAKCCRGLEGTNENKPVEDGWYAIQRNPNGTKKIDNCVIVCYKCLVEIQDKFSNEIPMKEFPCWGKIPKHQFWE